MIFAGLKTQEERKRAYELLAIVVCSFLLISISRLETRLFSLGELLSVNREFFTTLIYFALINLNVILILMLSFLLLRNITKLVVERKKGVLGSALRKKLVIALVFFALAPTLILFYLTSHFITRSFETWFSEKVQITIQRTQEAGSHIYKQDQKRLASLARLAMQRVSFVDSAGPGGERPLIESQGLAGFDTDYGLNAVRVYSHNGVLLWSSSKTERRLAIIPSRSYALEAIHFFENDPTALSYSRVAGEDGRDVVSGSAPLRDPITNQMRGVLVTEVRFESQILKSVEQILADFADLKPGAQLIRLSYMILIGVVVLLILFSATWLGFYVAKEITGPIQNLAEATREVALGNYNISLKVPSDDEMGQLVNSFNRMTRDLREQELVTEKAQFHLQKTNEELDHKRQYLEIVLKHITAGVLSLDPQQKVTSINAAAEKLLNVRMRDLKDRKIKDGLGNELHEAFWVPIQENLMNEGFFHEQLELSKIGREVSLLVNAIRLHDENDVEMGYVVVFEDALEKIRAQRVLAWREVARRIAHEIKNPITPIKLNAQRLVRRFRDNFEGEDQEVFRTCMETIITQVDSLRDLVNEFAKFSKLPNIKPKRDNLGSVLQEVTNMFKMSYGEIEFLTEGCDSLPVLAIDREQINRAFVNIFNNAVGSLVEGRRGKITAKCRCLEEFRFVRVEIADNGCGIPNDLKERVLEPYFSTKDGGTGLGLAIVHQIVSDHGGYLRLSDNQPFGAVVIIELPIV
uniref:histidine kinase n=1 Tax=uncultured bacterium Ak20-3 TaxID=798570 RepID=D9MX59_9BACT|nr:hypothetical protein AKSOIL_0328 [uncultured bacterium Ak20-3]